jgi:hypothetical protein
MIPKFDDFAIGVVPEQGGRLFPSIFVLVYKILRKCKRFGVALELSNLSGS